MDNVLTTTNQVRSTTPAITPSDSCPSVEPLLTLAQAAQTLPRINGRQLTTATVWRWCRKGIQGVFLEHQCIGRALVTTPAALTRFFQRLADRDKPQRFQAGNFSVVDQPLCYEHADAQKEVVCQNP